MFALAALYEHICCQRSSQLARSLLSSILELNGINFVCLSVPLLYSSSGYSCQVSLVVLGTTHCYPALVGLIWNVLPEREHQGRREGPPLLVGLLIIAALDQVDHGKLKRMLKGLLRRDLALWMRPVVEWHYWFNYNGVRSRINMSALWSCSFCFGSKLFRKISEIGNPLSSSIIIQVYFKGFIINTNQLIFCGRNHSWSFLGYTLMNSK